MTWVDIFLVLLIFFFGFGGYQRGLVRELFDLVILGLGLGVALRFFVPVGENLQRLTGASGPNCKMVAFLVLFLLVALLVLALGMHLDQMHAEDSSVPRPVKFGLGAVLGALKGLFMAWLFLLVPAPSTPGGPPDPDFPAHSPGGASRAGAAAHLRGPGEGPDSQGYGRVADP